MSQLPDIEESLAYFTADLLGLADVHRWTVIKTLRSQSVAEHAFNTAVIVMELAARVGMNILDAHDAMKWALIHDLPETLTGDIDGKFKRDNPEMRGLIIAAEAAAFPHYEIATRSMPDNINSIVKLADKIEAVMFIRKWGNGKRAEAVGAELYSRVLPGFIDKAAEDNHVSRDTLYQIVEGMLYRDKFETRTIQTRNK